MKLESQVINLEVAKRLKELGVKQESVFVWMQEKPIRASNAPDWRVRLASGWNLPNVFDYVYAFTVAELGEMLPEYILGDEGMKFDLTYWKDSELWQVSYWWDEDSRRSSGMKIETTMDGNEANARGKMLIYLLENSLITLK